MDPPPHVEPPGIAPLRTVRALHRQAGVVAAYQARDPRLDEDVLLRVLVHLAGRPEGLDAFADAVGRRRRLRHPGLAAVVDAGRSAHGPWIATRPAPSRTLDDLLAAEGRLSAERTIAILAPVAAALDAAHETGLVCDTLAAHGVLVRGDGAPRDAGVLADAGPPWPRSMRPGRLLRDVDGLAPEEIRGDPPSPSSNVYALAVLLVRCLTGAPPYVAGSREGTLLAHLSAPPPRVSDRVAGLPADLDDLVASALAKDPDARPATARALVARAAEVLDVEARFAAADLAPPASPAGAPRRTGTTAPAPGRRSRRALLSFALAVPAALLIALGMIAVLRSTGGADRDAPAAPGRTAQTLGTGVATATLLAPGGRGDATAPSGTVRVEAQRARTIITIAAQGLAPEPRKPVAAYAVWLANSPRDALALGFVVPAVGSRGRFVNHRDLPAAARRYREVLVTLERGLAPIPRGPVVLRGPLRLPAVTASGSAPPAPAPRPAGRSGREG